MSRILSIRLIHAMHALTSTSTIVLRRLLQSFMTLFHNIFEVITIEQCNDLISV